MKNLLHCDGILFVSRIKGEQVSGRITVEDGYAYLCQDIFEGKNCRNKRGYKYSWFVGEGGENDLEINSVSEFRLTGLDEGAIEAFKDWWVGDKIGIKDDNQLFEVIFRSGELVVLKELKNGTTSQTTTIDDLYSMGCRIVPPDVKDDDEEIKELTMDEIAEKFGLPVDKIRVKKD